MNTRRILIVTILLAMHCGCSDSDSSPQKADFSRPASTNLLAPETIDDSPHTEPVLGDAYEFAVQSPLADENKKVVEKSDSNAVPWRDSTDSWDENWDQDADADEFQAGLDWDLRPRSHYARDWDWESGLYADDFPQQRQSPQEDLSRVDDHSFDQRQAIQAEPEFSGDDLLHSQRPSDGELTAETDSGFGNTGRKNAYRRHEETRSGVNPLRRSYIRSNGRSNPLRTVALPGSGAEPRVAQSPAPLSSFVSEDGSVRVDGPREFVGKGGPLTGNRGSAMSKGGPVMGKGGPVSPYFGPSDSTSTANGTPSVIEPPFNLPPELADLSIARRKTRVDVDIEGPGGFDPPESPPGFESELSGTPESVPHTRAAGILDAFTSELTSPDEDTQPDREFWPVKESYSTTQIEENNYKTVQVFYGTDRTRIDASDNRQWLHMVHFLPIAFMLLISIGLGCVILFAGRHVPSTVLIALCFILTLALAKGAAQRTSTFERSFSDAEPVYGAQTGKLEIGICRVSIPKTHELGRLESPSIFRFEVRSNPMKHIALLETRSCSEQAFYEQLQEKVRQSRGRDVLVFVHGYNVTFENAARRTAQMAHDLNFQGAPVFYSWPSHGGLFRYLADATNVGTSVPALRKFLLDIARQSDADTINLIAHSMGNRALTSALRDLAVELRGQKKMFHEVILAAPDINAEIFKSEIAGRITETADRVTLYASSNDRALIASRTIDGMPRAGDTGDGLVVVAGIDTIDVSAADTSLLGHSYYGSNVSILADIYQLIQHDRQPPASRWLEPRLHGGRTYWMFQAQSSAIRASRTTIPR